MEPPSRVIPGHAPEEMARPFEYLEGCGDDREGGRPEIPRLLALHGNLPPGTEAIRVTPREAGSATGFGGTAGGIPRVRWSWSAG